MTPENLIWIAMLLPLVAIALIFIVGEKSPNIREACTIGIAVALFCVFRWNTFLQNGRDIAGF